MAPKPRNNKLIRGSYDSLTEEEKKKAVKLNSDYFFFYPLQLKPAQFKMKAEYTKKKDSQLIAARNTARTALKEELTINDFKENNLKTSQFMINGSALLEKDWRLFKKASPEMLWVKKSLAALNNILEEGFGNYINDQGLFDAEGYIERINKAYQEFFDAAENYLSSRNPSSTAGKRRYRRVAELLNTARQSKIDNYNLFTSIKDGAVEFDNITPEKKNSLNAYNIINEVNSNEADPDTVVWQNEGNSTDVYRLKLKGEDQNFYYLKENLPFLNYNLEGFIARRLRQLQASKANRQSNPKMEEQRLKKISVEDYDNGINFLNAFKNALTQAGVANKQKVADKLVKYLGHDFDKIFKEFELYNKAADYPAVQEEKSLDELIATSQGIEKQAYLFRKQMLEDEGNYIPGAKAAEVIQKTNAVDWLKKKLKLKDNEDTVLLNALQGLSDKEVENIFRYTLGKEVELYGQMNETVEQKGEDKVAINNTATARVAEHLGFDDVITKSKTSLVKFKRRDGTEVNQLCTICEEAPGDEFIDLMKQAERDNVKIVYSPEAIRNLMRLQAIDTLCFQKDRHGRNFKCLNEKDPVTGNIIIKSIKAYDNDMSFDACSLETGFKEMEDGIPRVPQRNQFLPAMNMVIKKDSALYKHVFGNYFGIDVISPPKEMAPEPTVRFGRALINIKPDFINRVLTYTWDMREYKVDTPEELKWNYSINDIKLRDGLDPKVKEDIINEIKSGKYPDIKYDENDINSTLADYAAHKFSDLSNQIRDIWFNPKPVRLQMAEEYNKNHPDKHAHESQYYFKNNLSPADKKKLNSLMTELKQLHSAYNFDEVYNRDISLVGAYPFLDAFVKTSTYVYDRMYGDTLENRALYQAKDDETYNAIKSLINKNGDLEIPSMLHYDNEAYERLCQSIHDFEDPNSAIVNKLKKIGLSDEKINAIATRNKEMKAKIDKANIKAQAFYKAAGWTTHPKNSFFLNKEDYKNIENLTDFAIDPGNTYLAIDNENYLAGQTFKMKVGNEIKNVKYTELMNENEILKAQDHNEYIKNDEKRWKYTAEEKQNKKYDVSNTDVKLITAIDAKYYVNACIDDAIYNVAHNDFDTKEKLMEGFKEILFTQRMRTNKPLNIDSVKKFMEKDSNLRTAFNNELNSPEGKIFMKNLNSMLENDFNNRGYKKLTDKNLEKSKKKIFDKSLDDIFDKLKAPGADKNAIVEGMAKNCKNMKDFAKKFDVDIDPETALQQFIQKNPGVLTQEQINKIMNAIKPQQAQVNVNNNGPAMNH